MRVYFFCIVSVTDRLWQLEKVEKVRLCNDQQLQDIRQQLEEKLRSADEKRDDIIKQLQEKLRLHVRSVDSSQRL